MDGMRCVYGACSLDLQELRRAHKALGPLAHFALRARFCLRLHRKPLRHETNKVCRLKQFQKKKKKDTKKKRVCVCDFFSTGRLSMHGSVGISFQQGGFQCIVQWVFLFNRAAFNAWFRGGSHTSLRR